MSLLSFAWNQNEKEDVIAAMWRHVALNSKAPEDQLTAYQNAVEVLEVWLGSDCNNICALWSFQASRTQKGVKWIRQCNTNNNANDIVNDTLARSYINYKYFWWKNREEADTNLCFTFHNCICKSVVPFSGFTNTVKRTKSYLCARHAPLREKVTLIFFFSFRAQTVIGKRWITWWSLENGCLSTSIQSRMLWIK